MSLIEERDPHSRCVSDSCWSNSLAPIQILAQRERQDFAAFIHRNNRNSRSKRKWEWTVYKCRESNKKVSACFEMKRAFRWQKSVVFQSKRIKHFRVIFCNPGQEVLLLNFLQGRRALFSLSKTQKQLLQLWNFPFVRGSSHFTFVPFLVFTYPRKQSSTCVVHIPQKKLQSSHKAIVARSQKKTLQRTLSKFRQFRR